MTMRALKNKHVGEAVWIIGKGPSLKFLKPQHIGEGPVIAINQAIKKIDALGLPNTTYGMLKDGGGKREYAPDNLNPECGFQGECSEDFCGFFVSEKGAALIVHDIESGYCREDYQPRYVFNLQELGLSGNVYSLIAAVRIAELMGCERFNFVSCDAHAIGDTQGDVFYKIQASTFGPYIKHLDYGFVTPLEGD